MKILIATANPNKLRELTALLPGKLKNGDPVEYVSLAQYNITLPPEIGSTLQENAEVKAAYAAKHSGLVAISDDTGLEVAALNGRPGVYTARYAGEHADADDHNRKLLSELDNLPLKERGALFKTVACLATPQGKVLCFEGGLQGHIGFGYRGENGFGYDPIFLVGNTNKTLAELSDKEKNKISHRANAFNQLAGQIVRLKVK